MKNLLLIAAVWLSVFTTGRLQIDEYNLETRKDLIYQVKDTTI